uniref:Natriuretic peptide C n=1 Tax=Gopherus evgoodei TaxID=1825980 RepID=A0A8C4YLJ3_9SAUR
MNGEAPLRTSKQAAGTGDSLCPSPSPAGPAPQDADLTLSGLRTFTGPAVRPAGGETRGAAPAEGKGAAPCRDGTGPAAPHRAKGGPRRERRGVSGTLTGGGLHCPLSPAWCFWVTRGQIPPIPAPHPQPAAASHSPEFPPLTRGLLLGLRISPRVPRAGRPRETAGGGGGGRGSGSRLLRELRADTKSRAAWARLLRDYPGKRRHKGVSKKGLSKGCFGLKLDRIGSMSGLGC